MNQIEDMKQQMLDMFEQFKEIDFKSTPAFYFASKVSARLHLHHHFSIDEAKKIAGGMDVDLSALGHDYKPHKEFLDSLSEGVAKTVGKMWPVFVDEFGRDVAFDKVSKINVYLR